MTNNFEAWTIYDHPYDHPNHFVARKFIGEKPTEQLILTDNLPSLYTLIPPRFDVFIPRSREDDPKIIGVYI